MVALAPLLGAGFVAAGAGLEVAVGGGARLDATLALLTGAAIPLLLSGRCTLSLRLPPAECLLLAVPTVGLAWTLSVLQRVEIEWDGRSIWLFHARMLRAGHKVFLAQAHLFAFSHPDYPPLVPSSVLLGWDLQGHIDYRTAQLVVAALTACATVLAGVAVARIVGAGRLLSAALALAFVLTCYGIWGQYGSDGYTDPLVAALVVAAGGYGLLAQAAPGRVGLPLALLVLAAATKNEGLTSSLPVLGVIVLRELLHRRTHPLAAPRLSWRQVAGATTMMSVWPVIVRVHGIGSDLTAHSKLVGRAADPLYRLDLTWAELEPNLAGPLTAAVALVLLSAVLGRNHFGRAVGFLSAHLLCLSALLAVYAFGPLEIHFWLNTSLVRTSLLLEAAGMMAALSALGLALEVLRPVSLRARKTVRPLPVTQGSGVERKLSGTPESQTTLARHDLTPS